MKVEDVKKLADLARIDMSEDEMATIASYASASPLIIAEKAGDKLQDNIVYARFGIYTLNLNTFKGSIENKFPFVKRDHSGIKAQIIGDRLKEIREREGAQCPRATFPLFIFFVFFLSCLSGWGGELRGKMG